MHFDLGTCEETLDLARRLGQGLFPGAVVGLVGGLGAGKTTFVRGVAEGLGIADSRVVSSPTFVLIQEYEARSPIYHFDVYRLKSIHEFVDLGVHEYFAGDGVCLVEWADRVREVLPAERLEVRFEIIGQQSRRLHLQAWGSRYEEMIHGLGCER